MDYWLPHHTRGNTSGGRRRRTLGETKPGDLETDDRVSRRSRSTNTENNPKVRRIGILWQGSFALAFSF